MSISSDYSFNFPSVEAMPFQNNVFDSDEDDDIEIHDISRDGKVPLSESSQRKVPIRRAAAKLHQVASQTPLLQDAALKITQTAHHSSSQLKATSQRHGRQLLAFHKKRQMMNQQLDQLDNLLENSPSDLGPSPSLNKPARRPMSAWDNAMNNLNRINTIEDMMDARVNVMTLEAMSYPVSKVIEGGLWAAKKVCRSNSKLEQECRAIKTKASALIKKHVQKALDNREKNIQREAIYNERQLQIPQVMTRQFMDDTSSIALHSLQMAGVASTFGVIKGVKKGFIGLKNISQKTNKLENAAAMTADSPKAIQESLPAQNAIPIEPKSSLNQSQQTERIKRDLKNLQAQKNFILIQADSHPTQIQHVINNVYHSIMPCRYGGSVGHALHSYTHETAACIPNVNHLVRHGSESVWRNVLHESTGSSPINPSLTYYKQGEFRNRFVLKITEGNHSFVIKDFDKASPIVGELLGLDFVKSLQLKHFRVADVLSIGQYRLGNADRYFIAKSYLPGESIAKMMKDAGNHVLDSKERVVLLEHVARASYHAGKAIGELHSKGITDLTRALPQKLEGHLKANVTDRILGIRSNLAALGLPDLEHSAHLTLLINKIKKSSHLLTYGLEDASPGQFVWSKKNSSLNFIDFETVPYSFSASKMPSSFLMQDYYTFLSQINTAKILNKLSDVEAAHLKTAFKRGYFSEYKSQVSKPARQWLKLESDLLMLDVLTNYYMLKAPNIDLVTLKKLVYKLNLRIKEGRFPTE